MENGSKALIMAASVFLGILLLSAMIYVFRAGAKTNEQYDERQANNSLILYNSKFELYDEENNSILDILSVANLAYNINEASNYDEGNAITIDIDIGGTIFQISGTKQLSERNRIFKGASGSNEMSIYNLIELPISASSPNGLGISRIPGHDGHNEQVSDDDKLSMSRYDSTKNETIYKYLFKSQTVGDDGIKYHPVTNKIIHMKFICYINENY